MSLSKAIDILFARKRTNLQFITPLDHDTLGREQMLEWMKRDLFQTFFALHLFVSHLCGLLAKNRCSTCENILLCAMCKRNQRVCFVVKKSDLVQS